MQQWYEFTTTKDAAGLSMYINITTTAKGAELCRIDSWEGVRLSYVSQFRQGKFNLAFSKCQVAIDTFTGYIS